MSAEKKLITPRNMAPQKTSRVLIVITFLAMTVFGIGMMNTIESESARWAAFGLIIALCAVIGAGFDLN